LFLFRLHLSTQEPGDKEADKGVNARDYFAQADWIWGCSSQIDSSGRALFTADAHRSDRKRFIVTADKKLTAFLELESVT
jgi:hypothetical protein